MALKGFSNNKFEGFHSQQKEHKKRQYFNLNILIFKDYICFSGVQIT